MIAWAWWYTRPLEPAGDVKQPDEPASENDT